MSQLVCNGAMITCSFGTAPSQLTVLPKSNVSSGNQSAAVTSDNIPMVNIMPFAMCTTLSNPQVAAATAAAQGVLTPMPCIPVTTSPWSPGCPTVKLGNLPALNNTSQLMCAWGGTITITSPGQVTVNIP